MAIDRPIFSIATWGSMVLNPRVACTTTDWSVAKGMNGAIARSTPAMASGCSPEENSRASGSAASHNATADTIPAAATGTTAARTMAGSSTARPVARSREMNRTRPVAVPRPEMMARMLKMAIAMITTPARSTPRWRVSTTRSTNPDAP